MAKEKLLPKSETDVQGFKIPRTLGQLRKLLTKAGVKTIHGLDQGYLGSGSQVTQKQFLALRVVYPKREKASKLRDSLDVYGLNSVWNNAVQLVSQSEEFQVVTGSTWLGLISLLHLERLHISVSSVTIALTRVGASLVGFVAMMERPSLNERSERNKRIIDVELAADDQTQEIQDNPEWQSAGPVSEEPAKSWFGTPDTRSPRT